MPPRRSTANRPPRRLPPLLRRPGALLLAAALASAGSWPPPVLAQDSAALKAAIVFNVLTFVQWPGEAELPAATPLRLCAERGSPLWPHLAGLRDRALRQFRLDPHELAEGDTVRDCRVLLLDGTARRHGVPGNPAALLTVATDERLDDGDAVLVLRQANGRMVFDVDLAAARRNGLQVSARLLRLARTVHE